MGDRQATYALRGFYYQFLVTIRHILDANPDDIFTIEGIVEDIDIETPDGVEAIQCKYYECQTFTLSSIYKPVLIMLYHFSCNPNLKIRYSIYIHTSDTVGAPERKLDFTEIGKILKSNDIELQRLIKQVPDNIDIKKFIGKFKIIFGKSLDDLEIEVKNQLKTASTNSLFVDELIFPNMLTEIGNLSVQQDFNKRQTTKKRLMNKLNTINSIALSKWAYAFLGRERVLKQRKRQLSRNLQYNSRQRIVIIDDSIIDFEQNIVNFILAFVAKYASKPKLHTHEPIIFLKCSNIIYANIAKHLESVGSKFIECQVGGAFSKKKALEKALVTKDDKSFFYKLVFLDDTVMSFIETYKCTDSYVCSTDMSKFINFSFGINVEELKVDSISDLHILLGV